MSLFELEEFIEAKEKELDSTETELKQLKEEEVRLQRHKQQLRTIRCNLELVLKLKQDELEHCREGLTHMQKNIFDQIYPIVSDIHHQELLVLELTEQLQLQRISKDVKYITSKISHESYLHVNKPTDILWCWYKEIKEYDRWYKANNSFNISSDEIPDCHFFYPNFKEPRSNRHTELSFSTRHSNFSMHVKISQDSQRSPEESRLPFTLTTDIYLESLEVNTNKALLNGETAQQFVETVIWAALDVL